MNNRVCLNEDEAATNKSTKYHLVKIFEFSNIVIINVDWNHILSLSVKVLFSYSQFQKSRENPYYLLLEVLLPLRYALRNASTSSF